MFSILFALLVFAATSVECTPGKTGKKGKREKKESVASTLSTVPTTTHVSTVASMPVQERQETGYICDMCKSFLQVHSAYSCSRCKSINYCSVECQRLNWKPHKVFTLFLSN
jgi:hypothetical protein